FYGTEAFGKSLYPNIGSCGSNEFGMGDYGASTLSCTAALSTGAWHFIAGTYNGAAAIFQSYVDGIANGSPSNPIVSALTNTYARIGAYSGGLYLTSRTSRRLPLISGIGERSATLTSTHPSSTLSTSSRQASRV